MSDHPITFTLDADDFQKLSQVAIDEDRSPDGQARMFVRLALKPVKLRTVHGPGDPTAPKTPKVATPAHPNGASVGD